MSDVTAAQVDQWLKEHDQVRVTREIAEVVQLRLSDRRRHPFPGNQLRRVASFKGATEDYDASTGGPEVVSGLREANVITSVWNASTTRTPWGSDLHRPVLDIDHAVIVHPSSNPAHSHLYLDTPMLWPELVSLMEVMADVGILEPGYVSASKARGYTAVRLPWITKAVA